MDQMLRAKLTRWHRDVGEAARQADEALAEIPKMNVTPARRAEAKAIVSIALSLAVAVEIAVELAAEEGDRR